MVAPVGDVFTVFVVLGDPMEPFVGHIDVGVFVQRDSHWPDELTRLFAVGAKGGYVLFTLFCEAKYGQAGSVRPVFPATVYDVSDLVISNGKVDWIPYTSTHMFSTRCSGLVCISAVVYAKKYASHRPTFCLFSFLSLLYVNVPSCRISTIRFIAGLV